MDRGQITVPSFAKINWILKVIGKRDDGYHDLFTVFQTIDLHDTLSVSESDELRLVCDSPGIPVDSTNLVLRAALRMQQKFGVPGGATLQLTKRIPAPGGLAGGSSNAAAAIIALARLWSIDAPISELEAIGAEIGSDVPFFFEGGTAIGTGRGTRLEPLADQVEPYIIVVTPGIDVSTATAFEGLRAKGLTKDESKRILELCRSGVRTDGIRLSGLTNDFEASVFAKFPEIERAKSRLLELDAVAVLMSGSGASVFAVFDKEETRQAAMKALDDEVNWRKFAVSTVSRGEYRAALGLGDSVVSD